MLRRSELVLSLLVLSLSAAAPSVAAAPVSQPPSHRILSEDGGDERRSVAVRLPARLSEPDLRRLAEKLAAGRGRVRQIVIRFYLDGMPLDQAPWASATIQSDMRVSIGGLRLEEEQLFLAELKGDRRQLLGAWLTSPPAVPGRLVIYRENGKAFAEWRLRNGLKTIDEVEEGKSSRGRRYTIKGDGAGHFVVTGSGDLELWQGERLMAGAERIALDKLTAPAPAIAASPSATPALGLVHSLPQSPPGAARPAADSPGVGREGFPTATGEEPAKPGPVTAVAPKPVPLKKAAVRREAPRTPPPLKSAARRDDGPVMRLQGQ